MNVDLLITDAQLPAMNGYQLVQEVRSLLSKQDRAFPTIFMYSELLRNRKLTKETDKQCTMPIDYFVNKPVQLDQLKQVLKDKGLICQSS